MHLSDFVWIPHDPCGMGSTEPPVRHNPLFLVGIVLLIVPLFVPQIVPKRFWNGFETVWIGFSKQLSFYGWIKKYKELLHCVSELEVFLFDLYKLELWTRPLTLSLRVSLWHGPGIFTEFIQKEIQQMVIFKPKPNGFSHWITSQTSIFEKFRPVRV